MTVADALVLFGATGDLAKRKLFPALYQMERRGELALPVVGVARSEWSDEDFRTHAAEAVTTSVANADPEIVEGLCKRLDLIQGDYGDVATWESLRDTLADHGAKLPVFYMAIPPEMFPAVAEALKSVGLHKRGRIVVEKPFGRDHASAVALNKTLHSIFSEDRIFRIDHYLGKESVEDLLVFRFSNMLLEPVWNRHYVRRVQITMSEQIGVEGRGSFYDSVGAIRDVFQNHLMQIVAFLAMEPPVGPEANLLRDEAAKVFASMKPLDPKALVRGQYVGYRDEDGVDPESTVETFAAARLEIDSWRWAGVPWYVRVGKALAKTSTEAVIELHQPPRMLFDEAGGPPPGRNEIRLRLGDHDGVTFALQAKTPGPNLDSQEIDVDVDFAAALGERQEAYERLLGDAIVGSLRRFARQDVVERTWEIVQPALDEPGPIHPYFRASWGPTEADHVLIDCDAWLIPD
ncbi:MAG: glucose-6-phosphate dehydrogenase [Ilumatobacteraceae bacterium]